MALAETTSRNPLATFVGGAGIGALGGLIGLGGEEFRLPLLMIGAFRFAALDQHHADGDRDTSNGPRGGRA
jgi:hypothetical protein